MCVGVGQEGPGGARWGSGRRVSLSWLLLVACLTLHTASSEVVTEFVLFVQTVIQVDQGREI